MIVITSTTDKLQLVLGGAITTNALQCFTCWRDVTTSAYTPGRTAVTSNNTTDVDLAGAPGASTYRVIDSVHVYNADTVSATVTVKIDISTDEKILWKGTLQSGWSLQYENGHGWRVLNASGLQVTSPVLAAAPSSVLVCPIFSTANLTTAKTITSGSSFAVYVGKAPRALTTATLRVRVTTAMATITWGEVAIAKGAINIGGNPTLTVVGYADVSATYNSTGQKSTVINVSSGQAINEGDDLWVLIGNTATTALQVRAASIADDLQVGVAASAAQRPSLIVGTATAFTIEGATTVAAWANLIV